MLPITGGGSCSGLQRSVNLLRYRSQGAVVPAYSVASQPSTLPVTGGSCSGLQSSVSTFYATHHWGQLFRLTEQRLNLLRYRSQGAVVPAYNVTSQPSTLPVTGGSCSGLQRSVSTFYATGHWGSS
jgi:hypothetical protein